jgi:predicted metal-dependent phosphoesterase TrpH
LFCGDLHVHTSHSYDGFCSIEKAVKVAKAKGLNGIAIADHNSIDGHRKARELSNENFLVILGIEVSSIAGHIVGLGVNEAIPGDLTAEETIEKIRGQGGIAIAAHPFRLKRSSELLKAKFDAIEAFNSRNFLGNRLAREFAEANNLPMTAGSDAHFCEEIGLAGVKIDCQLELDSVLKSIKKGETSIFGRNLPVLNYMKGAMYKVLHGKFKH